MAIKETDIPYLKWENVIPEVDMKLCQNKSLVVVQYCWRLMLLYLFFTKTIDLLHFNPTTAQYNTGCLLELQQLTDYFIID